MSYQFGKGTVVRDIACLDTRMMFEKLLNWKGAVGVSTDQDKNQVSSKVESTNTENIFPFKGSFSFNKSTKIARSIDNEPLSQDSLLSYMNQFIPNVNRIIPGFQVSLLKNDGTWDDVYYDADIESLGEINVSEFKPHNDMDSYARTCKGYMRCRIIKFAPDKNSSASIYYYLLDYLPQRVELARSATIVKDVEDEYYRDVKVGLNNLEGVTKVVVSQLDEDNEMPYLYEVKDFQKGYFIATVDKDYSTTFTITAYNRNGSTTSYPYALAPLDPTPISVDFKYMNNEISILASQRKNAVDNLINKVEAVPLSTNGKVCKLSLSADCKVKVSSLPKGSYVLNVYDIYNKKHTFKFAK